MENQAKDRISKVQELLYLRNKIAFFSELDEKNGLDYYELCKRYDELRYEYRNKVWVARIAGFYEVE